MSQLRKIRAALVTINDAPRVLCALLVKQFGSQKSAAKAVGITNVHFCKVAGGKAEASVKLLRRMAFELEIELEALP